MKKLLVFVGLFLLVSAGFVVGNMVKNVNSSYDVTINIEKGWNLIAGTIPEEGIYEDSEIQVENIKAMWGYSPIENKYFRIHPDTDWEGMIDYDDEYILTSSMLIYTDKSGILKYSTLEDYPLKISDKPLYAGWNFVTIIPEMEGKSLEDLKGSCNIEKAYLWDSKNQQWGTITNLVDDKDILTTEGEIGNGFIIKISENCNLEENDGSSEDIISPPTLP